MEIITVGPRIILGPHAECRITILLDGAPTFVARIEQHAANLDRKTGPVLLPDLTGVR